jgi:hypothetical protein
VGRLPAGDAGRRPLQLTRPRRAEHKGISVSLYSEGNGFEAPSAVVTVKKTTYTTQPDANGVEVDDAGKGGQVDADAVGIAPDAQVHVQSDFSC